jgi:DNA-binding HxlR family transcriptional regulator
MDYYWSAYQTEWATDVVFNNPEALAAIYPALVQHATLHFQSPDVMRFLGRKANGNFTGEIVTSFKDRAEGVRVKHWVRGNSIKMYDKAGSILRVETTIARTNDFKVLRPPNDDPNAKLEWKPLRKGVADLHRRAELSQRSNERYLDALAAVDDTTPCATLFDSVSRPVFIDGRRYRAMRIGDKDDLDILRAISRGEFATAGFRNREVRHLLHPSSFTAPPPDQRRLSAKVSRQLRLLRAHGLIKKVPRTHRYQLTDRGRLLTAALHATRDANIKQLLREAA